MEQYGAHDRSWGARKARMRRWLWELFVCWDQSLHVLLGGAKYVWRGGPCPSGDETISSKVGRQALRGKRWAIVCAAAINWVFAKLGEPDHCHTSIEWDEFPDLPRQ